MGADDLELLKKAMKELAHPKRDFGAEGVIVALRVIAAIIAYCTLS